MINNFFFESIKKNLNLLIDKFLVKKNKLDSNFLLNRHLRLTYGDQKGQVEYLINNVLNYEKNGLYKNGFFVDLACGDGKEINNTFFLENYLNWKGLLFEPNPNFKKKIKKNRKSILITKCVTDKENQKVNFRVDNNLLGGIVSAETDNNFFTRKSELRNAEIISIETTTLEKELIENNAPKIIDYLSLDIEGAEWLVLKNFSFDKYKFRCISIERPNIDLDLLLEKEGYKQVAHLDFDVIYVHNDFFDSINFLPKIKFSFTPKKEW